MADSNIENTPYVAMTNPYRSILYISFHLALTLTLIEAIISKAHYGVYPLGDLLLAISASILFISIFYLTLSFLFNVVRKQLLHTNFLPFSCSLYLVVSTLFFLAVLMSSLHPGKLRLAAFLLVFPILILAGISLFRLATPIHNILSPHRLISSVFIFLPIILFQIILLFSSISYFKYNWNVAQVKLNIYWIWAYSLASIGVTFVLILRSSFSIVFNKSMPLIFIMCLFSPFFYFFGQKFIPNDFEVSNSLVNKPNSPKHIILLTVDTLRVDALSCYNPNGVQTPAIDSLAKDSIVFRRAISPSPWTLPAFASIMTGLSCFEHRTTKINSRLNDGFVTIAEVLRDAGYYCSSIGFSPFLQDNFGISQGFEEYNWYPRRVLDTLSTKLLRRIGLWNPVTKYNSTRNLTRLAKSWLRRNHNKPFFLWIHYFDPHLPYCPPNEFLHNLAPPERLQTSFSNRDMIRNGLFITTQEERDWIKTLYNGEVEHVDKEIGNLLKILKTLGIYEKSLIVFASDHGEEFWEHGGFEHGHSLYNEVIGVPLLLKPPSSLNSSVNQVNQIVSTQSIMPTILEYCGISCKKNDLGLPSLTVYVNKENDKFVSPPVFSSGLLYYHEKETVTIEKFKYIEDKLTGHIEFYSLEDDPEEKRSLAELLPEKVKIAKSTLTEFRKKSLDTLASVGAGNEEVELDETTMEQLRSLGYVH